MNGALRDFREEDMYLELEFLGGEKRKMGDNQMLNYCRDDLCNAARIRIQVRNYHVSESR